MLQEKNLLSFLFHFNRTQPKNWYYSISYYESDSFKTVNYTILKKEDKQLYTWIKVDLGKIS